MYKIYVDSKLICSSRLGELALIDPVVELEANKAGSFTFTFPSDHAYRDSIDERKSLIDVYQDGELIFEGVATQITDDMYGQRAVTCEGELTFLNDSILRQHHYSTQTPTQLLTAYITEHNSQVDSYKQFTVGSVTVTGSATCYTDYATTMKEIGADLIDDFGGYLRVRHQDGVRYLDYLAESPNTNPQTIALGKNIIDLKSNIDTLDVCTVLIPLGAKLDTQEVEGLDARLTIKSVNDNKDYLESAAISTYGKIVKIHTWDDVTVAANLKTKGQAYLSSAQYANLYIELTAIDMGLASDVFEKFKVLDTVRIISEPHGIDRNMMITKLTLNLSAPESNTITLGADEVQSICARSAEASAEAIETATSDAYSKAVQTATALITSAMGGYVYKTQSELYIMDTNDPETATKVWRWNLNGLGYSSTGIEGPYGVAMTMDGSIVANYIHTGKLCGWNVSDTALYSDWEDSSGNIYRVYIQSFLEAYGTDSWIYSVQKSTNGGQSFNSLMYIKGDGSIYSADSIYSAGSVTADSVTADSVTADSVTADSVTADNIGEFNITQASQVSATSGSETELCSKDLVEGIWIIMGSAMVNNSGGSTSTPPQLIIDINGSHVKTVTQYSGGNTYIEISFIHSAGADFTVKLYGKQTTGSTKNFFNADLRCLRIR